MDWCVDTVLALGIKSLKISGLGDQALLRLQLGFSHANMCPSPLSFLPGFDIVLEHCESPLAYVSVLHKGCMFIVVLGLTWFGAHIHLVTVLVHTWLQCSGIPVAVGDHSGKFGVVLRIIPVAFSCKARSLPL